MDRVDELVHILLQDDPNVWSEEWRDAVQELSQLKDRRAVEPLCRYLKVSDDRWAAPSKRLYTIGALGKIGDSRAVEPLCQVLEDLEEDDQLSELSDVLARFGEPAVKPLCQQLSHGRNFRGRAYAAATLGDIGDVSAIEHLCRALKDRESAVRVFAANALGMMQRQETLPALKARLRPLIGERDGNVKRAIQAAIEQIQSA